jgi:RTX toxins and related Ca2+-binding proteins
MSSPFILECQILADTSVEMPGRLDQQDKAMEAGPLYTSDRERTCLPSTTTAEVLTASTVLDANRQASSGISSTPGHEEIPPYTTNPLEGLPNVIGNPFKWRWNYTEDPGKDSLHGLGTGAHLTYSFPTSLPDCHINKSDKPGLAAFSEELKTATRSSLASVAEMVNITFTETEGLADIMYMLHDMDDAGHAAPPFPAFDTGGFVCLQKQTDWKDIGITPPSYTYYVLLHELCHVLGLKHPHQGDYILSPELDNLAHTVMTYNVESDPKSLMLFDVEVLQYIYGANLRTRTGDDTYSWNVDPLFVETIWDAGGTDCFDFSNQWKACDINLQDGSFSSIGWWQTTADILASLGVTDWEFVIDPSVPPGINNIAIAKNAIIENAIGGSGNDILRGNGVDNILDGGAGADLIISGAGNDTLYGGEGNDRLYGGAGNDRLEGGIGADKLYGKRAMTP